MRRVTLRPSSDGSARFDIREAGSSFRGAVQSKAVARVLWGRTGPGIADRVGVHARGPRLDRGDVEHWDRRDWRLSLDYFMASRRSRFADDGADDVERARLVAKLRETQSRLPGGESHRVCTRLPDAAAPTTLGKALLARESTRNVPRRQGRLTQLSALLGWPLEQVRAARGVPRDTPLALLASFGAAYDFHVVSYDVAGLPAGLYEYGFGHHCLRQVRQGDLRAEMAVALIGQPAPRQGAATVCLTADYRRWMLRYRHERALRNLYFDAGRIMQRLQIVAAGVGWRSCITPAVDDRSALDLIGRSPASHQVMYTITVG